MDFQRLQDAAEVAAHALTLSEQRAVTVYIKLNGNVNVNWVIANVIRALRVLKEYYETNCYNEALEELYEAYS